MTARSGADQRLRKSSRAFIRILPGLFRPVPPVRTPGYASNPDPSTAPNPPVQDARLRDVWRNDPGALGGPPSRPVSVSSPAIEHVLIQAGHLSSPFGRALYADEKRLLDEFFDGSVDTSRIRIVETRIASAPTTLGNQIRVMPGKSFSSAEEKAILVHEAAHVWQYQNHGTRYITCSLYHQGAAGVATGTRNAAYFNYQLDERRSFSDYPAEQQAQIVEDYYSLTYLYAGPRAALPEWVVQRRRDMAHYERLMRQVRSARPRSQQQIYSDALIQPPRQDLFPPPTDPSRRFLPIMPFLRVDF